MAGSSSESAISSLPRTVIIIGAGWYGNAAAKTYSEVNPEVSSIIIDAGNCIGSSWSVSRIYPGLCADISPGAFEFADLSMEEALGIPQWGDLTRGMVHEHLEKYSRKHGILEQYKLETEVTNVPRFGSGWKVKA